MKVLFDHQIFEAQILGGISKSFCEFIPFLPEFGIEWDISIVQSDNLYLKNILPAKAYEPVKRSYQNIPSLFLSKQLGAYCFTLLDKLRIARTAESLNKAASLKAIKKGLFNVFHPTYFNPYFIEQIGKKPFILTVHDLIPEKFPQYYSPNDIQIIGRKVLIEKAAAIIAVSKNTKKDIIELFQIPEERISVIYHGAPSKQEHAIKEQILDHPYYLFVGGRSGYKNFHLLLRAFAELIKRYSEVRLICTGHPFSSKEQALLNDLSLSDKVSSVTVTDNQLENLYSSAVALVYPSQYEGFGMPILEAFSYGCPVLTYPASSLPEIGGDAAFYLDKNFSNFRELLEQLLIMPTDQRKQIIEMGKKRSSMFQWRNTASQYAKVYHSLC